MLTQVLPRRGPDPAAVRHAAWVARCVGRGAAVPLTPADVTALANHLQLRSLEPGERLFGPDASSAGVWLVRSGRVELSIGSGRKRAVLALLRPGDIEGDVPLLLGMPMPYTARALEHAECLYLSPEDFETIIAGHGQIARRWLASVAARLAHSQNRLIGLLGGKLTAQAAQLLLDEADDEGVVTISQSTLAAMLGARRPSLNKVLQELAGHGLISLAYRRITITDRGKLAALLA